MSCVCGILDTLAPYTDELNHLIAARNIAQGLENIHQISYRRSLYTVTLPVALFSKLFGFNLWHARFVGVLANIFAIIPLYLLSKRINKTIALLAVGLYIFSPWMIAVARNVREHAYYALFFFLVALVMVKLFESIPENIILLRDYRSLISLKILFLVSILVFVIFYVYVIDIFSTFKIILIYYPIFGIILLKKFDWTDVSNRIVLVLFLTIAGVGIGLIIAVIGGESMSIHRLNAYFLSLFYEKPPQQWYFNRPLISIFLIFFAFVATPLRDPKKFVHPFSSLVYIISLFTYSFIFTVGNRPRYSITILYWHIILMAIGLFVAYTITNRLITIHRKWLIWPVLLLVFWNFPQTFAPVLYNKPGRHPITDEYHGTLEPAYGFLQANVQADDVVVISDYLNKNYQLLDGLNSDNVISIYREDAEPIYEAMKSYPSGWIVIDAPRGFDYSKPLPLEDFSYAGKRVVFWGWFSDNYIYKWGNGS